MEEKNTPQTPVAPIENQPKPEIKPYSSPKWVLLIVALFIIVAIAVGGIYLLSRNSGNSVLKQNSSPITKIPISPTQSQPAIGSNNFYYITLTSPLKNQKYSDYPTLVDELTDILEPSEIVISKIAYDKTKNSPYDTGGKHKSSYYVILKKGSIDTEKTYKNEIFSATASIADPKLIPYTNDPDYCEVNQDCTVGNAYCSYGSFNNFLTFIDTFGCEATQYPEEDSKNLDSACNLEREHPEVEYSGSKCIANKCMGQNKTITCKEGAPI